MYTRKDLESLSFEQLSHLCQLHYFPIADKGVMIENILHRTRTEEHQARWIQEIHGCSIDWARQFVRMRTYLWMTLGIQANLRITGGTTPPRTYMEFRTVDLEDMEDFLVLTDLLQEQAAHFIKKG